MKENQRGNFHLIRTRRVGWFRKWSGCILCGASEKEARAKANCPAARAEALARIETELGIHFDRIGDLERRVEQVARMRLAQQPADPGNEQSVFRSLVDAEVAESRRETGPVHSAHEALSMIYEWVCGFEAQVFCKPEYRDHSQMLRELIQTAAMCRRTAEDLGLTTTELVQSNFDEDGRRL